VGRSLPRRPGELRASAEAVRSRQGGELGLEAGGEVAHGARL
jgi:hypothetical protein